jgi:hypothetical protein
MDKSRLSGSIESACIKVAPLMQAQLASRDFDVKPITPEERVFGHINTNKQGDRGHR